tara:strand:+ start:75 stop:608 length:534 start_codon:yes stop_codon:yes gene_type:complete
MILSCNSCQKKFVVPDNAIGATGRLVQCSSCGNKWKQFPIKSPKSTSEPKRSPIAKELPTKKVKSISKIKKRRAKKRVGPDLYSPEYLAKKHGIKISNTSSNTQNKIDIKKDKDNVRLGFYYSLIILIAFITLIFGLLINTQNIIISKFPGSEIYINYIFETLRNIRDIFENFFSGY